jgi:hypothetical protein
VLAAAGVLMVLAVACGEDGHSAADAERYANAAPDRITVRVAERDALTLEEAADKFAAEIAREVSTRMGASGYGEACDGSPCPIYLEGSLDGPPKGTDYECETTVDVQIKGTEAHVRRVAPFTCRQTRLFLDD